MTVLKNAIIDYTLPAVCSPVTRFPTTGDMAYHQPIINMQEDRAMDIGNMQKKNW